MVVTGMDGDMRSMYPASMGTVGEGRLTNQERGKRLQKQGFQASDKILRKQSSGMDTKTNAYQDRIADSIISIHTINWN